MDDIKDTTSIKEQHERTKMANVTVFHKPEKNSATPRRIFSTCREKSSEDLTMDDLVDVMSVRESYEKKKVASIMGRSRRLDFDDRKIEDAEEPPLSSTQRQALLDQGGYFTTGVSDPAADELPLDDVALGLDAMGIARSSPEEGLLSSSSKVMEAQLKQRNRPAQLPSESLQQLATLVPPSAFPCGTIVPNQHDAAVEHDREPGQLSPISGNIYLGHAAQMIHNIFKAAVDYCDKCVHLKPEQLSPPAPSYAGLDHPMLRIGRDVVSVKEFLASGRRDLIELPKEFFTDVDSLVVRLLEVMEVLSRYGGFLFLRRKVIEPTQAVQNKLREIKGRRLSAWLTGKAQFEMGQREQSGLNEVEDAVERDNGSSQLGKLYLDPKGKGVGASMSGMKLTGNRELAKCHSKRPSKKQPVVELSFGGPCKFAAGGD